jgi:hypothetical protein
MRLQFANRYLIAMNGQLVLLWTLVLPLSPLIRKWRCKIVVFLLLFCCFYCWNNQLVSHIIFSHFSWKGWLRFCLLELSTFHVNNLSSLSGLLCYSNRFSACVLCAEYMCLYHPYSSRNTALLVICKTRCRQVLHNIPASRILLIYL